MKDSDDDSATYISDAQFNFHQDVNMLYVSAKVLPEAEGKILDNVIVEWYGTKEENDPDSLILKDNGMNGDIIAEDDIYTLKFKNDSTVINNTLGDDSGSVYINILAVYVGQTEKKSASFKIGNIIPRIISISSPDTITRPSTATLSLRLVSATVFDADGLDNIKWVGFTSYHVEGDSMMNKGNYIYLYDDGSENIIYLPDITSGDITSSDGTYSFKIPIFGSANTDTEYQTKTGTFR
ncbi:MAG: hypothetical protein VX993_04920, partial [Candidatus Neomarinimicrobiota bacterium]|nr:hypothetical protein [Candidatus Neomarinimicrobiota bacterium]